MKEYTLQEFLDVSMTRRDGDILFTSATGEDIRIRLWIAGRLQSVTIS